MEWFLLIAALFVNLVSNGILRNDYSKRIAKNKVDICLFNTAQSVVALIGLTVYYFCIGELALPSLFTILHGAVFGMLVGLCNVFSLMALEIGPMSYTNIFLYCSMIIPSLSGMLLYGEPITMWQWVGTGMMLVSMCLSVDSKQQDKAGTARSIKWLLFALGAFFCNGFCGVSQKVYQMDINKVELGGYMIMCYIVSSLISLILTVSIAKKTGESASVLSSRKRFLGYASAGGLGTAFSGLVTTLLAGTMPAIIFFPVYNGASLLLGCLAGLLIWKERFTWKQWIGLCSGIIALVLLCGII